MLPICDRKHVGPWPLQGICVRFLPATRYVIAQPWERDAAAAQDVPSPRLQASHETAHQLQRKKVCSERPQISELIWFVEVVPYEPVVGSVWRRGKAPFKMGP